MAQPYMASPPQGSDQADEWVRLGLESQMASNGIVDQKAREGKLAEAQGRYMQALRLDPRHSLATMNLALIFAQVNQLNEALLTIERAEMFDGHHSIIKMNRALMCLEAGRVDDALASARKALELAPDDLNCMMAMAMMLPVSGGAEEAVALYNRMLDKDPRQSVAAANACFVQTLTDATCADLLQQRQRWHKAVEVEIKPQRHNNSPDLDEKCRTCKGDYKDCKVCGGTGVLKMRPLRVGYVGGDFKTHSASRIFSNVLFNHTPAVEMYLYSNLPIDVQADPMAKRFKELAGPRWRDISTIPSDEDVASLVRKDRIDILVDLAAHTGGTRLSLFLYKPAPIQVTAWGFAHGTGCPEIDYFLADPVAVPEEDRPHFAEKIWDLPCMLTLNPLDEYKLNASSLPPIRKNGYLTYGCYARYEKMSDDCLRTYAEIMKRTPDARMEFKDAAYNRPYAIRRIMRLMEGVEPERLLFSMSTTHQDHLLAYQQADLCLDPWPHCGGVVSLEQLYMGVPVLTFYGRQPGGRNTSCVLTAMKRAEWIARSREEYVEKAVTLAENPKPLADARKTLRQELLDSPVVKGYVEKVEEAYKAMWKEWCDK